jgi:hypothetical protein
MTTLMSRGKSIRGATPPHRAFTVEDDTASRGNSPSLFPRHPSTAAQSGASRMKRHPDRRLYLHDACILQGFNNDVRDQLAHCIQTLL